MSNVKWIAILLAMVITIILIANISSSVSEKSTRVKVDLEKSNVTDEESNLHTISQNRTEKKQSGYSYEKYVKSNTLKLHNNKRVQTVETNAAQKDVLRVEEQYEKKVKLEHQRREAEVKRRVSLDKSRNNYMREQQRRAMYQKRLQERSGVNQNRNVKESQQSKVAWKKEQQELQSRAKFVQRVKNQHTQE